MTRVEVEIEGVEIAMKGLIPKRNLALRNSVRGGVEHDSQINSTLQLWHCGATLRHTLVYLVEQAI